MVLSRDFGVGNVLTTSYAPDIEVAGNVVIGGITGGLKMWDAFSNSSVRNGFREELKVLQNNARQEAKKMDVLPELLENITAIVIKKKS